MIKVATVCMNCVYSKKENLKKYMEYIDKAAAQGARLIVFPEQSLQGYLKDLGAMPLDDYDYQYENAEILPTGESTQALIAKARETNMYIIYGLTERDAENDTVLYNSMALVGPEGYIGNYRKVHLPGDELHIYTPGKEFPVYNTEIGKIGMLICYDKSFPESARELAVGGAELLVMSTAWPFHEPENRNDVTKDRMYMLYKMYDKVRAIENQKFFISSNQFDVTGNIEYIGCSTITDPCGEELATTGHAEGIVFADIDVKNGIHRGNVDCFLGLNQLKDRNPIAYKRIGFQE